MNKKIVIIEGDQGVRDLFDLILTDLDFDTVFLEYTEHIYDELMLENPDLIIKDVRVLNDGNLQEINSFKNHTTISQIPLLVYSVQPGFKQWAQESLANAIMDKPFNLPDIESVVLDLLDDPAKLVR